MTLPAVIRIFFAIDLPSETKAQVEQIISLLKKKAKSHAIRWTRPENLHITLQFLPEVRRDDVPPLMTHVREKVSGSIQPIALTFGALHLFPSPYRPRVIVLEITPQAEVATLSQLIGQGIKACGYDVEDRPFRAHLTLGRIKQPKDIDLRLLSTIPLPHIDAIHVNEVILFRSEPQPEGSKYTVLEKMICPHE